MKAKLGTLLLVLVLALSAVMPCGALAEEAGIILSGSQAMIEGDDYYAGVESFIKALDLLEGLTLQVGSRGNHVAAFQSLLITSGYLPEGENDGIYGRKTADAVEAFQRASGLEATGDATVATQFMLVMVNSDIAESENGVYIAQAGNCAVVIWPDYSFYIGVLEDDGKLDYGTYYFTSGDYYAGDFEDDLRDGKGTAYHSNGDIYVGEWRDDMMNGKGVYYFGGPESGEYYDGEWDGNMMNGEGVYVTASGAEISGKWQNNQHKGW